MISPGTYTSECARGLRAIGAGPNVPSANALASALAAPEPID